MMSRSKVWSALMLSSVCVVGCDDPPLQEVPPAFGAPDAGWPAFVEDASIEAGPTPRVGPVFGVVTSDYSATSLSLLDEQGNVIADDYLNSGSARSGLVTALSGDVTLPSASGESDVLVILDRFKTDVVTRIRLSDATVLGQVKTHTPPAQTTENAYSSNPHDYVALAPNSAWISRVEPNLDPSVAEIDRGTDLLRLDPSTMMRTNERIDLSALNTKGTRTNMMTMQREEVDVFARPSRMVRIGDLLVVGLGRMSFDFSAYATGMIALANTQTRTATGFELPGLAVCSSVEEVPGQADMVLVGCSGFRRAPADPRATGGIALVRITNGAAQVVHLYRASEHPNDPAATNNIFSLGGTLVGAVAHGTRATPAMGDKPAVTASPDKLVVLDLATGSVVRELISAEVAFSIGGGLYDPATNLVLVPDSTIDANKKPTAGIRRFRYTAPSTFGELPIVKVGEKLNMPVRSIEFLGSH
jgi:hypothetical protein